MPTLQGLTDLFDELPELPPPLPRQRRSPVPTSNTTRTPVSSEGPQASASPSVPAPIVFRSPTSQPSLMSRLFLWPFWHPPIQANGGPVRKHHPFTALKAGKKLILIAVVDSGSISFFRFGQGAFTEWPMI